MEIAAFKLNYMIDGKQEYTIFDDEYYTAAQAKSMIERKYSVKVLSVESLTYAELCGWTESREVL